MLSAFNASKLFFIAWFSNFRSVLEFIWFKVPFLNKSKLNSVSNSCCYIKYVIASDELPIKKSVKNHNYSILTPLFEKYRYYDGSIPLRIFGRVVLFCHQLQEKVLIKKFKKENGCIHTINFCVCATKATQHIVRPYKKFCIFQPYRLETGKICYHQWKW